MPLKPNYQTWLFCDCSVPCVPYFSRRNRSIPFCSVPFWILVTTVLYTLSRHMYPTSKGNTYPQLLCVHVYTVTNNMLDSPTQSNKYDIQYRLVQVVVDTRPPLCVCVCVVFAKLFGSIQSSKSRVFTLLPFGIVYTVCSDIPNRWGQTTRQWK